MLIVQQEQLPGEGSGMRYKLVILGKSGSQSSSCTAANRLLLIDYLLPVRVAHILAAIRPWDHIEVVEPVVGLTHRCHHSHCLVLVVAAAWHRGGFGEFLHESVRFEVAPDVRGSILVTAVVVVVVILVDILVIRVVIVLVLFVVVCQMRIHLSGTAFEEWASGLIERMIPGGRHGCVFCGGGGGVRILTVMVVYLVGGCPTLA